MTQKTRAVDSLLIKKKKKNLFLREQKRMSGNFFIGIDVGKGFVFRIFDDRKLILGRFLLSMYRYW